jgi:uncharacterized damage-inducible protein DinB
VILVFDERNKTSYISVNPPRPFSGSECGLTHRRVDEFQNLVARNHSPLTEGEVMKSARFLITLLGTSVVALTVGVAQNQPKMAEATPTTGIRAELVNDVKELQKKFVDLADAIPQKKYSWRPMEGVRSVGEVYMHVVGANYLFPSFVGVKQPEGMSQDMETTVTEKAKVVEMLKESFSHLRQAILSKSDADLGKPAKLFGQETTVRDVLLTAVAHMHEHLGQSIAYARMIGVVPPWTAARQARQSQAPKK